MQEQELTLFGGWASVRTRKVTRNGVYRRLVSVSCSTSSLEVTGKSFDFHPEIQLHIKRDGATIIRLPGRWYVKHPVISSIITTFLATVTEVKTPLQRQKKEKPA